MHSFVVSGRGAGQGSAFFLFALSCPWLLAGRWPASQRASVSSLALGAGLGLSALVFLDDSLGPLLGQAWLRPALWALLLAYSGGRPSLSWLGPLPLGVGFLFSPGPGSASLGHGALILGLAGAGLLGSRHFQVEAGPAGLGSWVSLGESFLAAWSEGASPVRSRLGSVFYEYSSARLNLPFLRRAGSADILQQSLCPLSSGLAAVSPATPLVEPLAGLGLGAGLACLLFRKAPRP